ncbi:unnamed protein product [Linum tenue]|uniref:UBP-type domain-containing protein n=1 Tax=Linum tenue TaxID=586396 RepID=A0AAV0NQF5_9ROSI|nr:unnamed protein product [Linum tenue]
MLVDRQGSIKRQKIEGCASRPPPYDDVDDDEEHNERSQRRNSDGRAQRCRSKLGPVEGCPYLDTVNRQNFVFGTECVVFLLLLLLLLFQVLDFDFEKFCSVSLSNLNVYACLVCGKYYQGRGKGSHAYAHSFDARHHVYINLHTEKLYCLPDGYEIVDPSLDDIRQVLNPRFTKEQVAQLDRNRRWSRALDGSDYLPGMVYIYIYIHTLYSIILSAILKFSIHPLEYEF